MTERDRKVLIGVIVAVVLGGFWMLVLGPKRAAVSEAQVGKQEAQAALDTATAAEAAAKNVKIAKPVEYSKLLRLGKAIPVDDDFASLLVQVSDLSDDADVSFIDLAAAQGANGGGATGSVGASTCDAGATGATGAAATPATGATPPAGASGASGSTAETFVGKDRDDAKNAAATSDSTSAAHSSASVDAANCASAPTLADLSAQAAGLTSYQYSLTFKGSFFNLDSILAELLDLVKVHNAKVTAVGRLLDIKSVDISVDEFPQLHASVQMTGYSMPPAGSAAAAGATPATGTPAAATTPAPAPAPAG
jgi:hypothetical protein